jgi:DNA-binding transcriptional MerR regulator
MGTGGLNLSRNDAAQPPAPDETAQPPAPVDSAEPIFTITDLAREFAVTSRTLRFYEDEGLLHPLRRGTTRLYSRADRARLAWILRGRAVGFSLADIRDLLDMYAPGEARRPQLEATLGKSRERITALKDQRAAIDATIAELEQFCSTITQKL